MTTTLLLNAYTVQPSTPIVRNHSITGEFILTGKRGATYRTYRPFGKSTVQFIAESGKFCHLLGNYSLPLALIEQHAVTLNDSDRIA